MKRNFLDSKKNIFSIALFLLLLTGFHIPTFAQDEDEVINVDSSLVVVNVTISDVNGKPITGLKQNQFKILEDGQPQQIEFFEAEKTPFAAVILIDTSGSMESSIPMARSAAINFLDGLREDDVSAVYNFDSKVSLVQGFSNSRDIVENIFDLKADGLTALNDAIHKAAVELATRAEKRRAIIVLSDGADTRSKYSSDKAIKAALAANATIFTIDMSSSTFGEKGKLQNQAALKNFAEKSGGKFVATPGGVAMRDALKNIVQELGVQYTLAYQPTNLKRDGKWRAIEIRVAKPDLNIRTRKGYYGAKDSKK